MQTNTNTYGTRTLIKAEPLAASVLLHVGAVRSIQRRLVYNVG